MKLIAVMNCKKLLYISVTGKRTKRVYLSVVYFILFFAFENTSLGQNTEARATLDTNTILIGKQIHLLLELKQDKSLNIQWPLVPDTIGKIEVVSRGNIDTVKTLDAGVLYRKQALTITAFDSGYFVIPPVAFNHISGKDTSSATTQPLLLTVLIMPMDTTKAIHDIKDLAEVPFNWRDYIWYFIIVFAAILIILTGLYIYFRFGNKVKGEVFISKPQIPAHETALAALKELDDGKHWQNGRYKYYHSSISEIVRTFIEQRWQIHAMEQTTDEIVNRPQMLQLAPESLRQLEAFLKLSDLAKFAKLQPLANENEQSMRDAVRFVKEHADVPEAAEKEVEKA